MGAVEKAWATSIEDEVVRPESRNERVSRRDEAAQEAKNAEAPKRVVDLMLDMSAVPKRVSVLSFCLARLCVPKRKCARRTTEHARLAKDGFWAVGRERCALPAGCAYAIDLLEGCLKPVLEVRTMAEPRTTQLQSSKALARGAEQCASMRPNQLCFSPSL